MIFHAVVYERNTSGRFGGLSNTRLPFALLSNPTQTPLRNNKIMFNQGFSLNKIYTSSPLFLDNIIFSLDILHGRKTGGLHGPQVNLAELGQHAVEPAVDGLEQCCHELFKLFDYLNSKLPMVLLVFVFGHFSVFST